MRARAGAAHPVRRRLVPIWRPAAVTTPFDPIVTAQQVGSYKPADGHFVTARERIGTARWLHAAQSHFHDVTPARRHRIASAWINRKHLVRGDWLA